MKHVCKWCDGPTGINRPIRSDRDAQEYFDCFDARFPAIVLKLRALIGAFG